MIKNIIYSMNEVVEKLREIDPCYIPVLQRNAIEFLKQKLLKGHYCGKETLIEIPDWEKFVAAIQKESATSI